MIRTDSVLHTSSSEPDTGGRLTLPELLEVARLTPAQAAQVVADIVSGLAPVDGGRRTSGLRFDTVTVTDSGALTIEGARAAASRPDARDALTELLRDVASNCHGSEFADRLDETLSETTDLDDLVAGVRRATAPELVPDEEARRRRQIGALVAAATRWPRAHAPETHAPETHAPVTGNHTAAGKHADTETGPAASLAPSTGWYPPVATVWHRRRRRPSRGQGMAVLIVLVALVGAVVAGPRLWEQLSLGWSTLLHPASSPAENHLRPVSPPPPAPDRPEAAAGGSEPAPVRTGAPAGAGPITRVTASFADGACSAGRPCAVRVDVRLGPAATVDTVAWTLNVYDRCTGDVRAGGDVSMPAEPGRDGVYGLSKVFLPPGSALAVAAVTSSPAVAGSEPLYVPAETAVCP